MKLLLTTIIISIGLRAFSQGDVQDVDLKFNSNERSLGISFISNGLGLDYKIGRRIDGTKKLIFEFDANWFKHPKELKIKPYDSGNRFVYGKTNIPYSFKVFFGRQKIIYEKLDKGSVTIQYFTLLGVGGVALKPIYYLVISEDSFTEQLFNIDEIHSYSQIYGKASFLKGIDKTTFIPSASVKMGFNFDFAKSSQKIHALEAGIVLDAYLKQVPIMATEKNEQFYFTIYVTYRFGKTVETRLN